jgi:hypothetical protein
MKATTKRALWVIPTGFVVGIVIGCLLYLAGGWWGTLILIPIIPVMVSVYGHYIIHGE